MTAAQKVNLLGLTQPQMETFFTDLGEKRFRAAQLMKWIHHMGVDNFEEMTNIGKDLRAKLAEVAEITAPTIIEKQFSADGTRKWVLDVGQGSYIETVLIPDGNRGTLCVSSQVGCALDCDFCSTGKQGFQRDLTVAEIVGQVWIANRSFGAPQNLGHHNITNVVMMGMGEPLLNFNNVVASLHVMKDDLGYGISKRRVTVSTSGVVPAIKRLSEEIDVSLAISLHAPNNGLRDQLVPVNKKYPLEQLIPACADFLNSFDNTRRTITMEYVMLKEVNDKPEHAYELLALLKNLPVKMNLIPFNPFPHAPYERSSNNAIRRFQKILQDNGMITTVRTTRGDDIDAACGQLVGQVKDRTRRNKQWQATIYAEKQNQESSVGRSE